MPSRLRTPIDRSIRSAGALWISLLPALSSAAVGRSSIPAALDRPGFDHHGFSRPYLAVILPPPLRFAAAVPAPAEMPRLASLEPIVKSEPTTVAQPTAPSDAASAAPLQPSPPARPATGEPPLADPTRGPAPVRILPDDVRREIRPEDFLPYFILPGSSDAGVPPSSASYRLR